MKTTAQWRSERPWTSAVKDFGSSLHDVPGCGATEAPPDMMHTWHHGVGREFTSSAIVPWLHTRMLPLRSFVPAGGACGLGRKLRTGWQLRTRASTAGAS